MYDDLDILTLDAILDQPRESTKKKMNSLVIIDDFGAALKDNDIQRQLKEHICSHPNLRISIWILVLSYVSVPLQLRKAMNNLIPNTPRNKIEFHKIFKELVQLAKETMENLMRLIFDAKYKFMFLDCTSGHIYQNFDLIKVYKMPRNPKKPQVKKNRLGSL
jgi:hypothetical protein